MSQDKPPNWHYVLDYDDEKGFYVRRCDCADYTYKEDYWDFYKRACLMNHQLKEAKSGIKG